MYMYVCVCMYIHIHIYICIYMKNWCFWTVVLDKTLESPLDCKEIQPVHSEYQPWDFLGRNDAKAETPVLWPPHVKSWLITKDSDGGRDWRQEEKGTTGWDGWMASLTQWTWVCVNSGSWWWTWRPGVLRFKGSQRVGHDWATDWSENKVCHSFYCFPIYLPWSHGTRCLDLSFLNVELKANFFTLLLTFIRRLCSPSSLSAIRVVSSAYLRLLIFLPAILILACASSSPAFLMMHSAYKLNKQGDNIQPWHSSLPIGNQSVVPCPVLAVVSWPAYRFLKRQVRCSGIPISFRIFHNLLWSTQSNAF